MADLSDVTAYLAGAVTSAVYPNGTSQPSVVAMDVRIFEGWPLPNQLDLDLAGKTLVGVPEGGTPVSRANGQMANVSIFPMLGMTALPYQILDDTYVIVPPVFGLSVSLSSGVITITGTPTVGEYVTIVADDLYVFSQTGNSAASVIANLATAALVNYPGTTSTSSTLTIPYGHSLIVRQGAVGTLGKVTHRQKHSVMVTVWSPDHRSRTTLAQAIDVLIKSNIKVTLPDTSQAIITYNRTSVIDDQQAATIYRRDLIYEVEYATLLTFTGYVITTVNTKIANFNNSSIVPALT